MPREWRPHSAPASHDRRPGIPLADGPASRKPRARLRPGALLLVVLAALGCAGTALAAPEPGAASPAPHDDRPAEESSRTPNDDGRPSEESPPAPASIALDGLPDDSAIGRRIADILEATGWFAEVAIDVDNGVVFLAGVADSTAHQEWAENLARSTEGVTAVVNELVVARPSPWDLAPALHQVRDLAASAFRALPLLLIGGLLLGVSWFIARLVLRSSSKLLGTQVQSDLLRDVLSRTFAVLVFVLGAYVVLRVAGLTGLAVTIVGGTGLLGLAIGFAFRDIAENFLASVLISIQRPFAMDDLIAVDGHEGYVQRVNTRATVIMTRDGNHVQIPNSIIYKNTIVNFTANPRAREDFVIGIGYDDSIAEAQSIALAVLAEHPAVLDDPEPLVLVRDLGAATVNLRILFWIDISKYSQWKVRSAIIRLTKSAFDASGISMPDEAREVVFPQGVPIVRHESDAGTAPVKRPRPTPRGALAPDAAPAHRAEGDLTSDAQEASREAPDARQPEGGKNLL